MRLIDADALKEQILDWISEQVVSKYISHDACMATREGARVAFNLLNDAPTIDAAPVVRGEWIAEQKGAEYCEFRCSSCDGSIGQTDQFDETEVKQFSEWYKCCPMCGAMMRGEA